MLRYHNYSNVWIEKGREDRESLMYLSVTFLQNGDNAEAYIVACVLYLFHSSECLGQKNAIVDQQWTYTVGLSTIMT